MVWRKNTTEEVEELRHFVEGMKRGQTLATGDSLLETLRQIHDRREAPIAGHDHKQLLQERLRRQMRANRGLTDEETSPVPVFAMRPAPPSRFLRWAVAASLVLHVGLGVLAVRNIHFEQLLIGYDETASSARATDETVIYLPPTIRIDPTVDPKARPTTETASSPRPGRGNDELAPTGTAGPRVVPTASSLPIGPPVAPTAGAPIVAGYRDGLIASQADAGIGEDAGPSLAPPEAELPSSEVLSSSAERIEEAYDIEPKILHKPAPIYPERAWQYQVKGIVRVSAVLGADGSIREVKVIKSLGYGLDEAAMDAVRRIKFNPAQRGGKPVSVRLKVDISFGLH